MGRRLRPLAWTAAAALLAVGILLLARSGPRPDPVVGTALGEDSSAAPELVAGQGSPAPRRAIPGEPEEGGASSPGAALPPPPGDLVAQLVAVALAEQAVFGAGDNPAPELLVALEDALGPLLFHPEVMPRILDLLRAGELRPRVDHLPAEEGARIAGKLGIEEYGAVRALYWAILAYVAPYGAVKDAGLGVDGAAFVMEVLLALPDIAEPVLSHLLHMLTEARLDEALVLDATYLEEILRLRALFPGHEGVFSSLLVSMGEGMSPEERTSFFQVFLPDVEDPILLGVTLRNLLQGADPAFALWLAGERFDDAAVTPEMRDAIASAVVEASADPFAAVEFLTTRAEAMASMPHLFLSLGTQGEEATLALESKYHELLLDGADSGARRLVVSGMRGADPEQVLEIARNDPDPGVRGQALMTVSANSGAPLPGELLALREAYTGADNGIRASQAMGAASNLARRARANGQEDLKREAVSFLVNMAEDRRLSGGTRRTVLAELKGWIDELRWAELAEAMEKEK